MNVCLSAYLDNNIGDDLMIITLIKEFPEIDFYLFNDKSVIQEKFKYYDNLNVYNNDQFDDKISDFDLFLTIGGSMFNPLNSKTGKIYFIRRLKLLRKLKAKNIKIATIGVNFPILKDRIAKFLLKKELKKNDLVTVRDLYSYEIAENFKIKNTYLADDFVLNIGENNSVMEKVKNKSTDLNNKNVLGISTYRNLSSTENNIEVYKNLSKICDEFLKRPNTEVKLFCFDSETENDLVSAHYIKKYTLMSDNVKIVPYLNDEIEFIKELNTCDQLISIRFHSIILARILGIPTLPIAYSNKTVNLLNDLNYCSDILLLQDIEKKSDEISSMIVNNKLKVIPYENNSNIHLEKLRELFVTIGDSKDVTFIE